jgi:small subunit ribosomal protein S20
MPHTASAKKRMRQNLKRHAQNKAVKSLLATKRRQFKETIVAGDADKAASAFVAAQKAFAQAGVKGPLHKNTAARKVSRMAKQLAALKKAAKAK